MKKFISIVLCLFLSISVFASTSNTYQFNYEDYEKTIIFEEDNVFTDDQRQYVADLLVYGSPEENISTYSWCWLTGHDMVSDSVIEIQHKVSSTIPRCRRTIYEVSTCSKCGHVETTKLASSYIDCCPED